MDIEKRHLKSKIQKVHLNLSTSVNTGGKKKRKQALSIFYSGGFLFQLRLNQFKKISGT